GLDAGEQRALRLEILRPVLLDQCRARDRRGRIVVKADPGGVGARRQPETLQARPGRIDERAHPRLVTGRGVVHRDGQAAGEKLRGPAGADGAGAEHGDALDLRGLGTWHGRSRGQRRYSTLPSTPITWPETRRPASEHR